MGRVQGFDIARGVAVALVVLLHATLLPQNTVHLPQPICRMALLLLISGALAAPALERGWDYARRRSLDLVWLVLVWTAVQLWARGGPADPLAFARELVAPSTRLWYIESLALLVASAALLRGVNPIAPLTISGAAAAWFLAGGRTGVLGYDQFIHFALFFYLGLYGRARLLALLERCGARVGAAAAIAFAAMLVLPIPHTVTTLGSAAALLLVAQALSSTRAGAALAWFGRRTPDVYLGHVPLLLLARRVIGPFGGVGLTLLVLATIAGCLLLRVAADRIGLAWLYRRPRWSGLPRPQGALRLATASR